MTLYERSISTLYAISTTAPDSLLVLGLLLMAIA